MFTLDHGHDPDEVDYNVYDSSACFVVLIDAFREWYDTKPKIIAGVMVMIV